MKRTSDGGLRTLHPAYFALVMATGIVSIACDLRGLRAFALGLLWINVPAYAALCALTALRALRYPRELLADLSDHARGVGFFTLIAGTCVLGVQLLQVVHAPRAALAFLVAGAAAWLVLTYGVLAALTVRPEKPALALGLHGGWLVLIVATQSVSVLAARLAPEFGSRAPDVLALALVLWLGGGMLHFWIISLIFYRYTFLPMSPADLAPPYWINMGAAAISTLAGTLLVASAGRSPLLLELQPFLKGFTLFFWSSATWWIPMLVLLGVWRHVVHRFPLAYHPLYWGAVFPLGMYAACTQRLSETLPLPMLDPLAHAFVYVALAAWTLTFLGMLRMLARRFRPGVDGSAG